MEDKEKIKTPPSIDKWLEDAKADPKALKTGMFLVHNGVVRETPRAKVREGIDDGSIVEGMEFSYNEEKVNRAIKEAYKMDGIFHVRVWLNEGVLEVGEDIMFLLIGGDIRSHVIDVLEFLIEKIKTKCVMEREIKRLEI